MFKSVDTKWVVFAFLCQVFALVGFSLLFFVDPYFTQRTSPFRAVCWFFYAEVVLVFTLLYIAEIVRRFRCWWAKL